MSNYVRTKGENIKETGRINQLLLYLLIPLMLWIKMIKLFKLKKI